ncbi:microprocessor complex subunit DGCR8-like isoform X2 [Planococcus citri]|uniref:microprocessor complex subunit DGCR8-like isoform X2 n=1 Tax=Planococcus citri TaxID=170843 RepID=UPI0031F8A76B
MSKRTESDEIEDSEEISRINKKLKTCSFNYLEHKIQKEYGGGLIMCVKENNADDGSISVPSSSHCPFPANSNFHPEKDISIEKDENFEDLKTKDEDELSLSNESVGDVENSEELELSELEELLDADLPTEYKKPADSIIQKLNERKKKDGDFVEVEKIILDDITGDHFDLLPEGWMQMIHHIGIPVYLNRPTRVCTLARPYFLGSGNAYYRKAIDKIAQTNIEDCSRVIGNLRVPITKVETVHENHLSQSLDATEVREYCQKLFKFKKVHLKHSSKHKQSKTVKNTNIFKDRPSLPAGTKLISFPIFERDGKGEVIRRREWIMNPSGKSYIAILHEYLQQSLKLQPLYEYKENDNNEYEAIVFLKGMEYGKGKGSSKKEAKLQAAKITLEMLIPELDGKAEEICGLNVKKVISNESVLHSNNVGSIICTFLLSICFFILHFYIVIFAWQIFDEIKITDPRVAEFCARTTEPSPYSMLLTCLRRNCGTIEVKINYNVSLKHNKNNQFTMTVGKHTVTVHCRNKRDGKQKAAQAILQALHPQLKTWGSLVRLYGNRSIKNAKEKKMEEQEITQLQTQAKINSPNYAILNKLNEELEKLLRKKLELKPVGMLVTSDVPRSSGVNLNPLNYS